MPKFSDKKFIYEIRIDGGTGHSEWAGFYEGVSSLNGKSPDFSGISSVAIVGSHHDPLTIKSIVSSQMSSSDDISVIEIISDTLENGDHAVFARVIRDALLPYGNYPNVSQYFDD